MKKFTAIILALTLVVMACVPFCASAEAPVTFALNAPEVKVGAESVDVTITMNNTTPILNGGIII